MTAHTPGPWTAIREDGETWKIGSEDYGTRLAVLHDPYGTSPIEANARLIAAAPELLEALRLIAESDGFNGGTWTGELQGIARAAIAKAEGR